MRILFCNKYNYPFSGTEAYMFEAMELLRSKGHGVALFSMMDARGKPTPHDRFFMPGTDFKKQVGWFERAGLAAHAVYSWEARRRIRGLIAEFRPDVAHVRNIYHHLSPSILWELKEWKIPVVYHLNDFKVLCASYNLVSHGNACEACEGRKFWHALTEKCYPGVGARMTLVAEAYLHRFIGTYKKCVDCFLAPSQFVRDKFVAHGWDASRFVVLPHFQPVAAEDARPLKDPPILYFGRLSAEKGVDDLISAMQALPHLKLEIAGDGPTRGYLQHLTATLGLTNVRFLGQLQGAELGRAIGNCSFTVLPSHAYETLGKTILESFAHGRAVIATDFGSRRELVHEGKTGLLYPTGKISELVATIDFLSLHPELAENMGKEGREKLRKNYTPEAHYEILIGLYERLAAGGKTAEGAKLRSNFAEPEKNAPFPDLPVRIETRNAIPEQSLILASSLRNSAPTPGLQKDTLRIAFIGGRGVLSKYSGIENYYEEIGKRLAGMGHEVTAYCRSYFTPEVREHNGMRIVRLPTIRSKHLETLVHTFLSTLHVLTQPCDVVHYHALGPALFSFIPRIAGKKTVVTVQGLDWQRKKWGRIASAVLRLGEGAAVKLPTGTMVVSRTLQKYYGENHGAKTSYIPNGGLLRERRTPDKIFRWGLSPRQYILFLGRFSPEKGCHLLVEAYERIKTDVKLVMAGAASYCDDYSRELRTHASDKIVMLDWVSGDALDELLTNAMLFVLPSDLEGLSLALLDAMGAGLCVLTSDVPENREAIEDAGFTFRRRDVADLTDRLRFLIANPAVREAAGNAAQMRIREHYQWSTIATQIEQKYFEVMGSTFPIAGTKKPSGRVVASVEAARRKVG